MMLPAILFAALIAPVASRKNTRPVQTAPVLAHVTNSFHFEIHAPLARVAPLFGPEGERVWAGKHWDPAFLYPQPAHDTQGAVFTIQHGPLTVVWVNTVFDLAAGKMQYVYFIPDTLVTTIDVNLTAIDENNTSAEVTYTRTALNPEANNDVTNMGENDRNNGPQWQQSIEDYLTAKKK
jgi:hypothetical protein